MTAERRPTTAQNRMIADVLDDQYDTSKERYRGGWSDGAVATKLNFPRAWIEHIRSSLYGAHDRNEKQEAFSAEREKWEKDLKSMEDKIEAVMEEASRLRKRLELLCGKDAA